MTAQRRCVPLSHRAGRVLGLAAICLVGSLEGAVSGASAAFDSAPPAQGASITSVAPSPPSALAVTTCGVTSSGMLAEQLTLTWTPPTSGNLSGYVILVGGTSVASIAATQTTWTDGTPLAGGSLSLSVCAVYGAAGVWHADSSALTVTFQTPLTVC